MENPFDLPGAATLGRPTTSYKNKIGLSLSNRPEVFTPDREWSNGVAQSVAKDNDNDSTRVCVSSEHGRGERGNSDVVAGVARGPRYVMQAPERARIELVKSQERSRQFTGIRDLLVDETDRLIEGLLCAQEQQRQEQERLVARFLDDLGVPQNSGRSRSLDSTPRRPASADSRTVHTLAPHRSAARSARIMTTSTPGNGASATAVAVDTCFLGQWVDTEGAFFGGAVINISADSWHPMVKQDLQRPTIYTKTVLAPGLWRLAEVQTGAACAPDRGEQVERAFRLSPGADKSTLLATEEASGVLHILRNTSTPVTTSPKSKDSCTEDSQTPGISMVHQMWPHRPASFAEDIQVGLRFLRQSALPKSFSKTGETDEFIGFLSSMGAGCLSPIVAWMFRWYRWFRYLKEPQRTGMLSKVVTSVYFEWMCFLIIGANGMFIVQKTNYVAEHPDEPEPEGSDALERLFVLYFGVELFLKICVHQLYFFCNKDMCFNIFDTFVVSIAALEQVFFVANNGSFLRLLRVFKMVRVLRVARGLRFCQPLRLVLDMLVHSLWSLMRCVVLLGFILGCFAIMFTQAGSEHLRSLNPDQRSQSNPQVLVTNFGSVGRSMVSLFMAVSGGMDWQDQYWVLTEAGAELTAGLYLFFILFFTVAFWNIVTGQFMQETMKLAAPDMDDIIFQKRKQDVADCRALMELVQAVDKDHSGSLSKDEFATLMQNRQFRTYFEARGIEIKDTEMFYEMLTCGSGNDTGVDLSLFVWGCLRMKGVATSVDLHSMDFESRRMHQEQKKHLRYVADLIEKLAAMQAHCMQNGDFHRSGDASGKAPPKLANGSQTRSEILYEALHDDSDQVHRNGNVRQVSGPCSEVVRREVAV